MDHIRMREKPLAVVTGAAGGMGRAIARRLGVRFRLALADVNEGAVAALGEALVEEGYDVAFAGVMDVGDQDSVDSFAGRISAVGEVAVLVHAAAVSMASADWATILRINFVGTVWVHNAFLPLVSPGGVAVFFASSAAHSFVSSSEIDAVLDAPLEEGMQESLGALLGPKGADRAGFDFVFRAYGASKLGVVRLVQRRVREWAERGVRVVSVSPGTILTPMWRRDIAANPASGAMGKLVPLGRQGAPSDIAATVDFLTSDLAGYITGSDIKVDGGLVAARVHGV